MSLRLVPIFAASLAMAGSLYAESPRFRFHKGETLAYHLVQTTKVIETVPDEKTNKPVETESTTKVDLVRKWKVVGRGRQRRRDARNDHRVDALGAKGREGRRRLRFLQAGRPEQERDGQARRTRAGRAASRPAGPALSRSRRARSAPRPGSRRSCRSSLSCQTPSRSQAMLGTAPTRFSSIRRSGPERSTRPSRRYACQEPKGGFLTVGLSTEVKDAADAGGRTDSAFAADARRGRSTSTPQSGRYYAARLKIEKELKNHQGDGSIVRVR